MYFEKNKNSSTQQMDFAGAEKFIMNKLQSELPANLSYHGIHHVVDVLNAALRIAEAEKANDEEIKLLRIAVLFHDAGFIHVYRGHEDKGCEMAREILPRFRFNEETIGNICRMIMATKLPQEPHTNSERIIADADLDYLGREDFYSISQTLFHEFAEFGFVKDETQWNEVQLNFLRSHHYHTKYCIGLREPEKQKRLKEISDRLRQ